MAARGLSSLRMGLAVSLLAVTACGASAPRSSQSAASTTMATSSVSRPSAGTSTSTGTTTTSMNLTPSAAYLADMSTVNGSLITGEAQVNGMLFEHALVMDLTYGSDQVEYDLGRHWKHLQAGVGLRDNSAENAEVRMDAFGDGRQLYTHVFTLGQSDAMDVDISGVLRLRLVATPTRNPNDQGIPVWGDPQATG